MREQIDAGAVLAWGVPRLRDLPWRRIRDPWVILVAEVMLQQTQARRVAPKWEAFIGAYPTPTALADAR
jgi:A/G-specific adenine glycosylase